MAQSKDSELTIIKKYSNRRLYDTSTSMYITLEDLKKMVCDGAEFKVVDAKSGDDLTKLVLTQIIFEQENSGHNLLPLDFLKSIIRFYDDNLHDIVPAYLDMTMKQFHNNQEQFHKMAEEWQKTMGMGMRFSAPKLHMFGVDFFDQLAKQQLDWFSKAAEQLNPFDLGTHHDDPSNKKS